MLGEPGDISRRLKERNRLDQSFFEKVERVFPGTARTNSWGICGYMVLNVGMDEAVQITTLYEACSAEQTKNERTTTWKMSREPACTWASRIFQDFAL